MTQTLPSNICADEHPLMPLSQPIGPYPRDATANQTGEKSRRGRREGAIVEGSSRPSAATAARPACPGTAAGRRRGVAHPSEVGQLSPWSGHLGPKPFAPALTCSFLLVVFRCIWSRLDVRRPVDGLAVSESVARVGLQCHHCALSGHARSATTNRSPTTCSILASCGSRMSRRTGAVMPRGDVTGAATPFTL